MEIFKEKNNKGINDLYKDSSGVRRRNIIRIFLQPSRVNIMTSSEGQWRGEGSKQNAQKFCPGHCGPSDHSRYRIRWGIYTYGILIIIHCKKYERDNFGLGERTRPTGELTVTI